MTETVATATTTTSSSSSSTTRNEDQDVFENATIVLTCPCQDFTAIPKILAALESEEHTKTMLDWLNGTTDRLALEDPQVQRLSCGKRSRCRFRYGTSFAILNAIRDACRPYLEQQQQQQHTSSGTNNNNNNNRILGNVSEPNWNSSTGNQTAGYEEAFPALGGSATAKIKPKSLDMLFTATSQPNVLIPRKKSHATTSSSPTNPVPIVVGLQTSVSHPAAANILMPHKGPNTTVTPTSSAQPAAAKKKHKRRIRPQPAGNVSVTGSSWGKSMVGEGGGGPSSTTTMWGKSHSPFSSTTDIIPNHASLGSSSKNNKTGLVNGNISSLSSEEPLFHRKPVTSLETLINDSTGTTTNKSTTNLGFGNSSNENEQENTIFVSATNGSPRVMKATITTFEQGNNDDIIQPASEECLKRMVDIFTALITNHLAPSTALELHLLLRLLTITKDEEATSPRLAPATQLSNDTPLFFRPLFCNPQRCRTFAVMALTKISFVLKNLGLPLLKPLVQCTPFRLAMPEMAKELDLVLQSHISRGLRTEYPANDITGTHAILSLPFQHERDSRHNYKSQAELAMYKNREESRDAFLYQLRAFVDVRKGNLLLRPQAEVERALERIRVESRNVLQGLLRVNMAWFAQFFCDLLLQMGLAPMEEMDQELLTIAGNKEKLQKLHKRFSSKGTHTNKSTKKLVLARRKDSEAQHCFPGHQEFFFTFLQSVDNYSFGVHLRNRIIGIMLDLSANHSATTSDIEKRFMNMQMFSRFLGYLVFSPNWDDGADMDPSSSNIIKPPSGADALQQLDSLGLSLDKALNDAWQDGYAVEVIPWVTELLKMAKWDYFSQTSRKYRLLLAQLRCIQEQLSSSSQTPTNRFFGPTRQILSFYLETFFHETVGFIKLTSLPKVILGASWSKENETPEEETTLDQAALGFSSVTLFASSPHVEDLYSLITRISLSPSTGGKSPGKARKLRPSIVSSGLGSGADFGTNTSNTIEWSSPSKDGSARRDSSPETSTTTSSIQAKLVDAFFHQHRDLKEVCEFTVNRVLKNVSNQLAITCIKPVLQECGITAETFIEESFQMAQQKALTASSDFLRSQLVNSARPSFELLGPSGLSSKIIDVAVSLAVSRGMQAGKPIIDTLVTTECATIRDSLVRAKKKQGASKNSQAGQRGAGAMHESLFQEVLDAIANLLEHMGGSKNDDQIFLESLRRLENAVNTWRASDVSIKMPPESSLHTFFQLLLRFDEGAPWFVDCCLNHDDQTACWLFLAPYLRVVVLLAEHTKHGMRCLANLLGTRDELLRRCIECGAKADDLEPLLIAMVESNLVSRSQIRNGLWSSLDSVKEESSSRIQKLPEWLLECNDPN